MHTGRFFHRNGLVRCLAPRLASSPNRCADNLHEYMQRLIARIGLRNGRVIAKLHDGGVSSVHFAAGTPGRRDRRRSQRHGNPRPAAAGKSDQIQKRRAYTPDQIIELLKLRLSRLLRHCELPYGRLWIDVKKGRIRSITPAASLMYNPRELPIMAGFFSKAPPSRAWRQAKTDGDAAALVGNRAEEPGRENACTGSKEESKK